MNAVDIHTLDTMIFFCYAGAGVFFTLGVSLFMVGRKENSTMARQFGPACKYSAPLGQLDRRSNEALIRSANRIIRTAEVARVVMDEVSVNHVTAAQLASQAMATSLCQISQCPETELTQAYFKALSTNYLVRMAKFVDFADQVMMRQFFDDDED